MLRPLNKYLTVERAERQENKTTVILPEDEVLDKPAFCAVKLVSVPPESSLSPGLTLVVPQHMVEEVVINNTTYYLVLENSVVGYIEENE